MFSKFLSSQFLYYKFINVIFNVTGTGKTRTLVAIVVSLLVDVILKKNRQNKQRILVCFTTHDSLNSFVCLLESVKKHIEQTRKTFNYVSMNNVIHVIVGSTYTQKKIYRYL
jgi:hypothetical protein